MVIHIFGQDTAEDMGVATVVVEVMVEEVGVVLVDMDIHYQLLRIQH